MLNEHDGEISSGCEACPRVQAGILGPCIGYYCPMYCEVASQGQQPWIARILAWKSIDSIHRSESTPVAAALPGVATALSTLGRMKACPHRTEKAGCGCGGL